MKCAAVTVGLCFSLRSIEGSERVLNRHNHGAFANDTEAPCFRLRKAGRPTVSTLQRAHERCAPLYNANIS